MDKCTDDKLGKEEKTEYWRQVQKSQWSWGDQRTQGHEWLMKLLPVVDGNSWRQVWRDRVEDWGVFEKERGACLKQQGTQWRTSVWRRAWQLIGNVGDVSLVKYKFIKTTFIKKIFSSKSTFIKNHFHQKPISSKCHFHQNATFIKNHFHQKPISSKTNFIRALPVRGTHNIVRICVKASRADGPRRLHTNTACAHLWTLSGPFCWTLPAFGRNVQQKGQLRPQRWVSRV